MKKLLLISFGIFTFVSLAFGVINLPEATGYVVDTINLLKPQTVSSITQTCQALDKKAQIAVCIVATTQPDTIEQFGIKLAEKWKVGYKGVDNGIIIILAKNDRKVRIEVGRGLEAIIPDAKAGRIVSEVIIPYFKKGDWDGGLLAGINAIKMEVLK